MMTAISLLKMMDLKDASHEVQQEDISNFHSFFTFEKATESI
ncbi:hypothetical protein MTBBW1_1670033 [Desulfamplus magnetovallimortis]|uniref:Uncharacterized protein n=1 Tax=Desulfamplus magnetovallimortis TaxID=1246637 RepID=A0A1W1H959_9BACT|nr:hypothetical protein MTBBW1_1670033 [Desulfamplus magnetovallimortis]